MSILFYDTLYFISYIKIYDFPVEAISIQNLKTLKNYIDFYSNNSFIDFQQNVKLTYKSKNT